MSYSRYNIRKDKKKFSIPNRVCHSLPYKYPFDGMEVGDSFFIKIPPDKPKTYVKRLRATVGSCIRGFLKRRKQTSAAQKKWKFTTRTIIEDNEIGVRVWRTK